MARLGPSDDAAARTSIVIPAHNDANRLAVGRAHLAPVLEETGPDVTEALVIDDGSSDEILRVADNDLYEHLPHALSVQQPTHLGKGAAVRLGIAMATRFYVIAADVDMSISPSTSPRSWRRSRPRMWRQARGMCTITSSTT
jgi:glycosyltransferase involved in cell wall biosynthesis